MDYLKQIRVKLIKEFTGREVEKLKVYHPYQNRLVPITIDDYVTDLWNRDCPPWSWSWC